MTAYILTPITEIDNLPDGDYRQVSEETLAYNWLVKFKSGKWASLNHTTQFYLRPVHDVVISNANKEDYEIAEEYLDSFSPKLRIAVLSNYCRDCGEKSPYCKCP